MPGIWLFQLFRPDGKPYCEPAHLQDIRRKLEGISDPAAAGKLRLRRVRGVCPGDQKKR